MKVLKRNEVEEKQTWDLTPIFVNDKAWEEEYEKFSKDMLEISKYEDKIIESPKNLLETLVVSNKLSNRISHLYVYAHLRGDVDTSNAKYQGYNAKVMNLYSKFSSLVAFINVKILELSKEKFEEFLKDECLSEYKFYLENIYSEKDHILSEKEEKLYAALTPIVSASQQTFGLLNNADLKFGEIEDKDGNKIELTHSRYAQSLESKDRVLRKNAYEAMYKQYKNHKNTFASTLSANTLSSTIESKLRNYKSSRNMALSKNFVDESVYDNLLKTVNENLLLLHKYMKLRKKILKLDKLTMYDLHTPIFDTVDLKFTFEEAQEIVVDALQVMGKDYIEILKKAFKERWIDYCENEGKRSGAYSSGTYGTNPYILMSYKDTLDNMFTLIHELGHSMHSYYTRKYQPYIYGHYTIFLAEVASTTNEMILTDYLLEKYKDNRDVKIYLLNHYLDDIKSTLFRQTQFAEFENEIYKLSDENVPLTAETLSKLYLDINKKYYGEDVISDENISYEWARIPHFYYNFYVYQYATGISAASAFSKLVREDSKNVEKYINYLKAGSSDYPLNILKKAGVDMSTPKPIVDCLSEFNQKLDELDKLLGE